MKEEDKEFIQGQIALAMSLIAVAEPILMGLDGAINHEIKQRTNMALSQLGRYNRYIRRLDKDMTETMMNKSLVIAKFIDQHPYLDEYPGRKEELPLGADSEVSE